ncbi:rho GTPase-activating protein 28 isoform X1 [Oncorhynchus tshawytscha]|uniref:Rho-GAP domain-containing protein n=2 Tax=Oncorhynchus tshawytscha TaxID=74940 RepID=A0A8C8JW58_ONCTS|nr:rho GTPase-activating protein 28 isoform X1 [Oncorhynchus tshawytscha]
MEIIDTGSVILTAYHSYAPSRIHLVDEGCATPLSPRHSPCRKVQYQEIGLLGRMSSRGARPSSPPSSLERPASQDSMEDYWSEVKNIEEDGEQGHEDLLERGSMDEAELEEAWLQEAGLSTLVSGELGEGPAEALLSTLTRSQAAMVKKRVDNYTLTMRKRNKQPARHVQDVFSTPDTLLVDPIPPVSPKSPNGHMASRCIHRTSSRVRPAFPSFSPVERRVSECPPSQDTSDTLSFEVPYSEGVTAHRRGRQGDCQDCQRIRRDDPDLPTFQLPRPKLGLTHIQDLSCADMKKIGYISLIELTTFYDCLGIELKRNRAARSKARESGIFGVPLTTLLENDQKKFPGSKVPLVFRKLLSKLEQTGLQTEGILRVPGSASRVKNKQTEEHLRQELEQKFYEERFDWEQVRHNDAAGLLKMFIRELPYPLLTLQHLPAFAAAQSVSSPRHQIQALHLLIMLLPEPNRDTLKALLEFLRKVVAYEEKNRMSLWNVSMIVAPNLFTYRGKNAKHEEMQAAAGAAHLVRLLITYQELLWTVPCFLISHVRKLNEASKKPPTSEKTKRKLLMMRKRNAEKTERSELTDLREGVIRVHAPLQAKISMAIQLDNETKAKDVMARFDYENGLGTRSTSQRPVQYLFEVGGNIGERCLDPETHLLDVYHVNPHCEWLLKPTTT